jgi:hypothetical protein
MTTDFESNRTRAASFERALAPLVEFFQQVSVS